MQRRLEELRAEIEAIDGELLQLAGRRLNAAACIGALKSAAALPAGDPEREQQLWRLWRGMDGGAAAARLFLELTGSARQIQRQGAPNIYIIGMPSAGKSSVGAAVARQLERPFCDLDTLIELAAGCAISEIFAARGEDEFRRLESELLALLSRRENMVIACGGGVVKRELNRALLGSGQAVWLRREREPSLEDILRHPRPLTRDGGEWDALERERRPLYRQTAAYTADNDADIESVAARICRMLSGGGQE